MCVFSGPAGAKRRVVLAAYSKMRVLLTADAKMRVLITADVKRWGFRVATLLAYVFSDIFFMYSGVLVLSLASLLSIPRQVPPPIGRQM